MIACLLVIVAGGGYLAWQQYQRIDATAPPKGVVGQMACQLRLRNVKASRLSPDDKPFLTNCLMGGYITKSDLDDAGLSP